MSYPLPPGDPNQQPAYPASPYPTADPNQPAQPYGAPAPYPTYPPADPNQPMAYPGQPPVYPTYPPADPNQMAQPYGAPAPYPTYPPADPNQAAAYPGQPPMYPPAAPSQPMYPPAAPSQPMYPPAAPSQPMYPPTYPPGYASPSMPMYQQPQQPYPYGAQPGMQPGMPGMPGMQPAGAGGMNFALLTQPKQLGFFIAAIAGVVLLLCFFIPAFFGATVQVNGIPLVPSDATQSIPPYGPVSAATFAGGLAAWLWLVPLCALAAAGLAVWRAVSTGAAPQGFTRRNMAIVAAVLGGVALLLLLIVLLGLDSYASTALGVSGQSFSFLGVSVGVTAAGSLGWVYWIMLLAAIGVGVGGIMQINTKP